MPRVPANWKVGPWWRFRWHVERRVLWPLQRAWKFRWVRCVTCNRLRYVLNIRVPGACRPHCMPF